MKTQRLGDRLGAAVCAGYLLGAFCGPPVRTDAGYALWPLAIVSFGYLAVFGANNKTVRRWSGIK